MDESLRAHLTSTVLRTGCLPEPRQAHFFERRPYHFRVELAANVLVGAGDLKSVIGWKVPPVTLK